MTDYRKDFPLLSEIGENTVDGREWIYIDNAATSQRPQCVIERRGRNSCLHHGAPQQSSAMADGRPTDRSKTAVYRVPPGWISRSGSGAGTDYRKDEDRRNHTGFQCPWADQSNQRDRSHGT